MKNQKASSISSTYKFIENEQESYTEVGDLSWQKIANWFNDDLGRVTKYKNVYKITQKNTIEIITKPLDNYKKSLIKQIEGKYKKKISKPIEKQISILLKKLNEYNEEQLSILNERENSEIDLNDKIKVAIDNNKRTKKLLNRVADTKTQLKSKG